MLFETADKAKGAATPAPKPRSTTDAKLSTGKKPVERETVKNGNTETAKKDVKTDKKVAKKKTPKPPRMLNAIEQNIVARTNAQRARYSLPPLAVDVQLVNSARSHAAWMTSRGTLQHTSAPVAENIAMGQRNTQEVVNSWMNSPGHRANILNRGHRRIGVAAFAGRNGTIYWCQQFRR